MLSKCGGFLFLLSIHNSSIRTEINYAKLNFNISNAQFSSSFRVQ